MEDSKSLEDSVLVTGENNNAIESNDTKSNDFTLHQLNNSKVCKFFTKNETCRFGKNCKFVHNKQYYEQSFLSTSHSKNTGFHDRIIATKSSDRSSVSQISPKKFVKKRITCRYFKAGNCDKGDNCPYQHSSDSNHLPLLVENISVNTGAKKRRVPICHYFKKGNCLRGEDCKFYHSPKHDQHTVESAEEIPGEIKEVSSNIDDEKLNDNFNDSVTHEITSKKPTFNTKENDSSDNKNKDQPNKILYGKKLYDVSKLSDDELIKLRSTEISQLQKRYPRYVISEHQSILFTFEPSDPDWPFDLKSLELEAYFPDRYPVEVCEITVALSSNNIPDMLIRHLNQSIKDWFEKRFEELKCSFQTELLFRPFLKWFDRNFEDLFICGLRKVKKDIEAKRDGLEFVPFEKLFPSTNDACNPESNLAKTTTENDFNPPEFQRKKIIIDSHPKNFSKSNTLLENAALKQGIKVLFNGLELIEGIATFSCSKLSMTVQCIRCKTSCNIKCAPGKSSSSKCSKCSKLIECDFNPSMMHQFSNVAGNLHVLECQIVDINLVESLFVLDCLNCSKQIAIDGLHYGQKQKRWCTSCNEKLIFSIENVKFQATSSTFTAPKNAPLKKVEKRKDPLFKEGEPLPDYGTCKHYKKSYRWLRFPCCGRLYPCDVCHDEKENEHEMKFASRMICGFCSKEQPYSKDKPCSSCSGSMTAKSGAHWEGGKGCRNKIKMARDDKHKYSGTSKTVSKKAQSTRSGKK